MWEEVRQGDVYDQITLYEILNELIKMRKKTAKEGKKENLLSTLICKSNLNSRHMYSKHLSFRK